MHVLVDVSVSLRTTCEVPTFTHPKDDWSPKMFNKSPLPLTDPRDAVPQAQRAVHIICRRSV